MTTINEKPENAERIQIDNNDFMVSATVETAPSGLMTRELVMNAFEARVNACETRRTIRFYADEDGKLVIINSGKGLTATELKECTDLTKSIGKAMGLKGRLNRGEGAKIASLKFNPKGMRYRSRKDGTIHEVMLFRDSGNGWSRKRAEVGDKIDTVWVIEQEDLTQAEQDRYDAITGDFVEVKLLGMSEEHQTAYDPYNTGKIEQITVGKELFGRFYDYPVTGIPIQVQFDGASFRGGVKWREFIPLARVVEQNPGDFTNLDERFVVLPKGLRIEYLNTKEADKSRSPWNMKSMGANGARAALVWRGEMYDLHEGDSWRREAPSFGLFGVANTLSVFIHIPDSWEVTDGRFREHLEMGGQKLTIRDFRNDVISSKPEWVKALIEAKRNTPNNHKDVRDALAKIAAKLAAKPDSAGSGPKLTVIEGGKKTSSPGDDNGGAGGHTETPGGGRRGGGTNGDKGHGGGHGTGTGGTGGSVLEKKKAPSTPGGTKSLSGVPMVIWLDKDKLEDIPTLRGRGAEFISGNEPIIYINRTYDTYNSMIHSIYHDYIEPTVRDQTEKLVRERVEFYISIKIGSAVLRALHKQGNKDWDDPSIKAAMSREALSNVFDLCIDDLGQIVQSIKATQSWRDALASCAIDGTEIDENVVVATV